MAENVFYLHDRRPREIAQTIRIGYFDHRKAEHLWSANKLTARRFVIEAANLQRQSGLLQTLRDANAEIILDTNVAELSVKGRFSGAVKAAPWAPDGRILEPDDLVAGTNRSVIEPIARCAVANGFTSVMAPTHYLADESEDWLTIDSKAAEALRLALDLEGGSHILVDYPLIMTNRQLRDPILRKQILSGILDLPEGQTWLRVAGFGADATGVGMSRYIQSVRPYHELGRPIIADQVGGIAGLATCAFGAVSGFACGVGGKQRFDAGDWLKNPKPSSDRVGRAKRVFLPGLDRSLSIEAARQIFDASPTARQIFGCSDSSCCGSIEKMLGTPEAHVMVQLSRAAESLSSVPESIRTDEFLDKQVEKSVKEAKRAAKLKKVDDGRRKKFGEAAKRLEFVSDALHGLHEREGPCEFAPEAKLRARQGTLFPMRSGQPS